MVIQFSEYFDHDRPYSVEEDVLTNRIISKLVYLGERLCVKLPHRVVCKVMGEVSGYHTIQCLQGPMIQTHNYISLVNTRKYFFYN